MTTDSNKSPLSMLAKACETIGYNDPSPNKKSTKLHLKSTINNNNILTNGHHRQASPLTNGNSYFIIVLK